MADSAAPALLGWALVLAVRYRRLQRLARDTRRQLAEEEERLIGSLALAEETVHRILLTTEIGTTLRHMAVHCAELLDLAGVRIQLDRGAFAGWTTPTPSPRSAAARGRTRSGSPSAPATRRSAPSGSRRGATGRSASANCTSCG